MTSTRQSFPSLQPRQRPRPLTCLGDASELEAGGRAAFTREALAEHLPYAYLRKVWEWDYIADCAAQLGLLDGKTTAIGLGVGNEPLIFHFANGCGQVIATDIYNSETAWQDARVESTEAIFAASPIPFAKDRLEIRNADMRALGQPEASVDWAWSTSSLEHVPTLRDVTRVLDELARVLKDGGVAILTTEFCVTEPPYHLPGVNAWDPGLLGALTAAMEEVFEFVGGQDLGFNWVYPANWMTPRQVRRQGVNGKLYNVLQPLFLAGPMLSPTGISGLAPIAFVLRRRPRRGRLFGGRGERPIWDRLRLGPGVAAFTAGVEALYGGDAAGARGHLQSVVQMDGLPPQQRLHAFRFYAEAGALAGAPDSEQRAEIMAFCRDLPPGEFQDADVLGYLAHRLLTLDEPGESARVFELAMGSPSTTFDNALGLIGDYLLAALGAGDIIRARGRAADLVADIVASRAEPHRIAGGLPEGCIRARVGDAEADAFAAQVQARLDREGLAGDLVKV